MPALVSEKPETVRIDPLDVAKVLLKLIRNGRLDAEVDFEAPPWLATGSSAFDFAVIGDTPYGAQQIEDLPNLLAAVDADESVKYLLHVGDIKEGSARCDDSYFEYIAASFSTLSIPLIFTPGDNEWTDCHRRNNGAYDPLERLAKLRELFFPVPGLALGGGFKQVLAQSEFEGYATFVENQLWFESKVAFSTVHVVGSADSSVPWYTDDNTGTKVDDPARRDAEREERQAATLAWLDKTFAVAAEQSAVGVVIFLQADIFHPTTLAVLDGFHGIAERVAALSKAFEKPVLFVEGDSHVYRVEKPFAEAPNLTRVVVQGSTTTPLTEWLKVHVDPASPEVFSWERKPR